MTQRPSSELIENLVIIDICAISLDLGNNGLGHYIVFESGFLGYSASNKQFIRWCKQESRKKSYCKIALTNRSITTSAIALYMPNTIKE